jgi:hypothetical protein
MALITLTRQQIARIVNNDPEAIRAIEAILAATNTTLPNASDDAALQAATASANAEATAGRIEELNSTAMLAALAPRVEPESAGLSVDPAAQHHVTSPSMADLAPAAL